ncbi:hypothetical protein GCM10010965_18720 [Caldalkalibacillus thermarum]|nr:hypothetical protein GCM10010965_07340 [Caldalkalibacillus thermarum]GGK26257.1 hypothetical protein GCM10010965_18720 [Caldalkalibacillus thermarum]
MGLVINLVNPSILTAKGSAALVARNRRNQRNRNEENINLRDIVPVEEFAGEYGVVETDNRRRKNEPEDYNLNEYC